MQHKNSLMHILALLCMFLVSTLAHANMYTVGCPGGTPAPYPSINSVLALLVPGDVVFISGTCTENVILEAMNQIALIGSPSATLAGTLAIYDSSLIYVYGFNVTSPNGPGIAVEASRDITFDTCTSNGNAGAGMYVENTSDAYVIDSGSFDNNANAGIQSDSNSAVTLWAFVAPIDVSNNVAAGINCFSCTLGVYGNVTITGNMAVPGSLVTSGFGVDARGAAKLQFGAEYGANTIQQNQSGGVSLQENSEVSFWGGALIPGGHLNIIQNNGPAGVVVSFGSQATFFEGARILNHSDVGVDVYGNSQAYFNGDNRIQGNGTNLDPVRAGLRVDGTSQAFLRGGQISQNGGPGVLALVGSSVDFASLTFGQNSGGSAFCDSSSYMTSDLSASQSNPSSGIACRAPNGYGNHRTYRMAAPHVPDATMLKAKHAYYQKLIAHH